LIVFFVAVGVWLVGVVVYEDLSDSVQEPAGVSVIFFVIGVGGEVACPVQSAVIVPDGKDVLASGGYGFDLFSIDFSHECDEVFGGVSIECDNFIAFFHGELFHHILDDCVGVVIKFLEVVAEIPDDMCAFKDAF
jgi:hypothetical protein